MKSSSFVSGTLFELYQLVQEVEDSLFPPRPEWITTHMASLAALAQLWLWRNNLIVILDVCIQFFLNLGEIGPSREQFPGILCFHCCAHQTDRIVALFCDNIAPLVGTCSDRGGSTSPPGACDNNLVADQRPPQHKLSTFVVVSRQLHWCHSAGIQPN